MPSMSLHRTMVAGLAEASTAEVAPFLIQSQSSRLRQQLRTAFPALPIRAGDPDLSPNGGAEPPAPVPVASSTQPAQSAQQATEPHNAQPLHSKQQDNKPR